MLSRPVILVGTDFSIESDMALRAAETLRKVANGKILLVHVDLIHSDLERISSDYAQFLSLQYNDRVRRYLSTMMEDQIKRCEAHCDYEISYGRPYQVIKDMKEKVGADLILVGHHGSGTGHMHLGGLVSKLIATSDIPVLVINKPFSVTKVAGLLEPRFLASNIFSWAEEFSFLFSADLQFISVWKNIFAMTLRKTSLYPEIQFDFSEADKMEILENIKTEISSKMDKNSKGRVNVSLTEDKSTAQAIVEVLRKESVDLAVINRHNKGIIEKILIGSTTRRILDLFDGNLLVLPSEQEEL